MAWLRTEYAFCNFDGLEDSDPEWPLGIRLDWTGQTFRKLDKYMRNLFLDDLTI